MPPECELRFPANSRVLVRWRLSTFWVCLIGYVGYYLCRGNLSAAFPLLEQEFGFSNTQLGLIASLSEIAYAIGKFINGPLADKVGAPHFPDWNGGCNFLELNIRAIFQPDSFHYCLVHVPVLLVDGMGWSNQDYW